MFRCIRLFILALCAAACDAPTTRVIYVPSGNMNAYRNNSSGAQQINPMVQQMYQEDNTRAIVDAINNIER